MNAILSIMLFLVPLSAIAQNKPSESDPFDISSTVEKTKKLGIPTVSEVDALQGTAWQLFKSEKCEEAIPKLEEHARKANFLANLISSGLDPFYRASYEDQKIPTDTLMLFRQYERLSNKHKRNRNISIAMQGECFLKSGNTGMAVSYLIKALDLFGIKEDEWWERTRINLYKILDIDL